MLKLRKKILVGALCCAMVLTASQSAWSESAEVTDTADASVSDTADTEDADTAADADADASGEEEAASITEEDALAEMKEYARTDSLVLFVNEQTGVFAVQNLKDGKYTWSNPFNSDNDPNVKSGTKRSELKSSMVIDAVKVTDTEAPSSTLRSAQSGDISIEKTDNGFKATVTFENEGISIPYYVTVADDHFDVSIAVSEIFETEINDPGNIRESS